MHSFEINTHDTDHLARYSGNLHGDPLQVGNALYNAGQTAQAVAAYQIAIQQQPRSAIVHNNLAAALADLGQHDRAIELYETAIQLDATDINPLYNLGNSLRQLGRHAAAVEKYQQALRLDPGAAHVFNNLGLAYSELDCSSESRDCFERAISLREDYAEAYTNLGLEHMYIGRLETAIQLHTRALTFRPNYPAAHRNRALARLLLEDLPDAWDDYDWRWECDDFNKPVLPTPLWQGEKLVNKTILLYTEQGFGDTLQFVRFCKQLTALGASVVLAAQPALIPLLSRCDGISRLYARDERVDAFDLHCPLLSVPGRLRLTREQLPGPVGYLSADPELIPPWRKRLSQLSNGKLRIGVCWQGSPDTRYDRERSFPVEHLVQLATLPHIQLFSLQKGPASERSVQQLADAGIVDLAKELDNERGAFMDTSAVMQSLDMVISADTAIGHLSAAMNLPTWIVLPFVPDWRWYMQDDTSPWYPSVRLFRQRALRDWKPVFEAVRKALCDMCSMDED